MHLAAESHVDRSIDGPSAFVKTNVLGTCSMLEATLGNYENLITFVEDRPGHDQRDAIDVNKIAN